MFSRIGHLLITCLFGRRSVGAALLTAYVLTASGVPLPTPSMPHTDEHYPCAGGACGCTSAEHCWRSCCCHTLAERFAWAREHNVRPPEYAIAAAKVAGVDLAWLGIKSPAKSLAALPSCCQKLAGTALKSCCQERVKLACCEKEQKCHAEDSDCEHPQHGDQLAKAGKHVVMWRALACGGQSLNWLAAVPSLVEVRPLISYELPLTAWLGPAVSDSPACVAALPAVPPPEWA